MADQLIRVARVYVTGVTSMIQTIDGPRLLNKFKAAIYAEGITRPIMVVDRTQLPGLVENCEVYVEPPVKAVLPDRLTSPGSLASGAGLKQSHEQAVNEAAMIDNAEDQTDSAYD